MSSVQFVDFLLVAHSEENLHVRASFWTKCWPQTNHAIPSCRGSGGAAGGCPSWRCAQGCRAMLERTCDIWWPGVEPLDFNPHIYCKLGYGAPETIWIYMDLYGSIWVYMVIIWLYRTTYDWNCTPMHTSFVGILKQWHHVVSIFATFYCCDRCWSEATSSWTPPWRKLSVLPL